MTRPIPAALADLRSILDVANHNIDSVAEYAETKETRHAQAFLRDSLAKHAFAHYGLRLGYALFSDTDDILQPYNSVQACWQNWTSPGTLITEAEAAAIVTSRKLHDWRAYPLGAIKP